MKRIALSQGKFALVDDEDYQTISGWKWYANEAKGGKFYARARCGKRLVSMHSVILWKPKGYQIDHINGNGLDNRRANLRICTHSQNQWNRTKTSKNTSGFKGVSGVPRAGKPQKWRVQIQHLGKKYCLGTFSSKEEAAGVYAKKANELFGEYVRKPSESPKS